MSRTRPISGKPGAVSRAFGSYVVVALIGPAWELILKAPRPRTYATIRLGTHAVTSQVTASGCEVPS